MAKLAGTRFVDAAQTIELLDFGFALQLSIQKSLEDGKFSFADAFNFYQPITLAAPAFNGIAEVPKELTDPAKRQLVLEYFSEKFDIPADEALENKIEKTLKWLSDGYDIVLLWK